MLTTVPHTNPLGGSNRGSNAPEMSADKLGRLRNRLRETPEKQGIRSHLRMTADQIVELGRIELPSARRLPDVLRPFPRVRLAVNASPGRLNRSSPPSLSSKSAFFHAASGLSLPSTTASVAGLQWSGPVRHCWSRFLSYRLKKSGGESELAVGGSLLCPD